MQTKCKVEASDFCKFFITFVRKKQKGMKHILMILVACLLVGCDSGDITVGAGPVPASTADGEKQFLLQGAWTLERVDFPIGYTKRYSEQEETVLRLYDGDSAMCQCWLTKTETGLIIKPSMQIKVTLIDKGGGEYVYLEDGEPRPLTLADDTTIVVQQNGALYTWHSADDIAKEWGTDIMAIVAADLQRDDASEAQSYVLSAKERHQANVIHGFIFSIVAVVILLLLIARIAIDNRKAKHRLQLQLQQIQEVQEERPQAVRQAIEGVETVYFASDEHLALQRRIATGQRLKDEDWQDVERRLKSVYPGFSSQLHNLYALSELEYQVCLLIKLRIGPKDIAAVLARDMSTISTVRSRLYKKVFGRKGGAKDWDEFIFSIGA